MIAATIIAKNEARSIKRCLDSVAPFVDEIRLVDTGSTDETIAIATACGAKVDSFAWADDFSAARNFSLERTEAPWRFVLDADEWLEKGGELLRMLGDSVPSAPPFVGLIEQRNEFDDSGLVSTLRAWIPRILPAGVAYHGRIHEQPVHRLPVRRLDIAVGHDGYRKTQHIRKGDRNERLLRAELARSPDDPYLQYQLGKELETQGRYDAASACYESARRESGWSSPRAATQALQARFPWLHALLVRNLYSLRKAGRLDDALALAQSEAPRWPHSPDFHFAVGDLLLDVALQSPQHAPTLLPRIEAHWLRCLEIGETPTLDGSVEGRGSFLAAHNLAVFYQATGNAPAAARYQDPARTAGPPTTARTA